MQELKRNKSQKQELPPIPEKFFFSIGEVSQLCDLKPHVLRYWEQEFPQLAPSKRRGNRRYYQRDDVLVIREIRSLLYDQGYTIEGARTKLTGNKKAPQISDQRAKDLLAKAVADLEAILVDLEVEES
ncbi:MAG: MerR family transcriptional regulator [Pseudomonadota bacterium]|nr:MerR family transcriptional regulator [Pseudomonadota bacterium]